MALIGKIREKSWLILIVIGGALVTFIMTDYQKIKGESELQFGYGTVNGEMVNMTDFDNDKRIAQENANLQAQQSGQPAQPVEEDKVWNAFTDKIILDAEYEALGIKVSDNEFDAFLYGEEGFDAMQDLKTSFPDSMGGLNKDALRNQIEIMQSSEDEATRQQWEKSRDYYIALRQQQRYFQILAQGVYVTNLEAKNEYTSRNEIKSISYVYKSFNEIKEDITVTDEELMKFYEENKNDSKYRNKTASREYKLFDVAIKPSTEDIGQFKRKMDSLKTGLTETTNDSLYIIENSDIARYSSSHAFTFKPKSDPLAKEGMTYPDNLDTIFKKANIGDVVGPYEDNGFTRVVKVIDFNTQLLSARHILIPAQRGDSAAVKKAQAQVDSLLPLINSDNFALYVQQFSQDPGSKDKGGKYEDFMDHEMVPEFSDFAKDKPLNQIGYVQTDYGFHIMEALERKEVKYPVLAIVQKELKPSIETLDNIDSEVFDILYSLDEKFTELGEDNAAKIEAFDSIAREAGYFSRSQSIQDNKPSVYGIDSDFSEKKILDLVYGKDVTEGTLISSPIKEKSKYIIAVVSSIREEGVPTFDNAKVRMRAGLIDQKKAELLVKSMAGSSLKTIADKNNTIIKKAEVNFGSAQITGLGAEYGIVGSIFSGLKDGQRSQPIVGKSGVIVVQIEQTTKAPTAANYLAEKSSLENNTLSRVQNSAKFALTKLAKVVDNRKFFGYNIRR